MDLDNLVSMMKEFDYKKNGKFETLKFLRTMIQNFIDVEWEK